MGCSSFISTAAQWIVSGFLSFPCHAEHLFRLPLTFLIVLGAKEIARLKSSDRCSGMSAFPLRAHPAGLPNQQERGRPAQKCSHKFHFAVDSAVLLKPKLLGVLASFSLNQRRLTYLQGCPAAISTGATDQKGHTQTRQKPMSSGISTMTW